MKEVTRRSKIFIIVLIVGWTLFGFFAIYYPMKMELVDTLHKYYAEIANSKYVSLATNIDKCREGARSISSRTAIRDVIIDYKKESMSLEKLQEFTQPKYIDGVKALDNVVLATRYVDKKGIAQYKKDSSSLELVNEFADDTQLNSNIILKDNNVFLYVSSPITLKDKTLGIDKVIFHFTDIVNSLSDSDHTTYLVNDKDYKELMTNSEQILQDKHYNLFGKNQTIYFIKPIQNQYYFVVKTPEVVLLSSLNHLKNIILLFGGGLFVVTLIYGYFYIIRFAKRKLYVSEKNRDRYKLMLDKDELTGACSKTFLEYWKAHVLNSDELYSIVMTDINDFKSINDNFGHFNGDKALKKVAEIMLLAVRDNDFVIRFGGDEFLLVLKHSKKEASEDVLNRIQSKIEECNEFDFKISISYGICELHNKSEFNNALVTADQRMYASKHLKKKQNVIN